VTTTRENARTLEELDRKYPGRLVMHRSLSEDEAHRFARRMVGGGAHEIFENSDSAMIVYVEHHLMAGDQVEILAFGRDHVMVAIFRTPKRDGHPATLESVKKRGAKTMLWVMGVFVILSVLLLTLA
jgi:hypothetical protein